MILLIQLQKFHLCDSPGDDKHPTGSVISPDVHSKDITQEPHNRVHHAWEMVSMLSFIWCQKGVNSVLM